jgi:hypothetical protein
LGTAAKLPDSEPIPVQKPKNVVTIKDIKERRARAGKLVAGTAASCDSDMFKAPVSSSGFLQSMWIGAETQGTDDWETQGEKLGP